MWRKIRTPLLFLSLGMNLAFLIVLGFFYFPGFPSDGHHQHEGWEAKHGEEHRRKNQDRDPGWSFYKHKIGVSDTQWANLRPDMEEFHGNALKICRKIRELRNKILSLIEDPDSNSGAIEQHEKQMAQLKKKKQELFVDYMIRKKHYLHPDQERQFFRILRGKRDCHKHARFLTAENQ
ncbi:MAG: hypothetical protein ABEK50_13325 [bacterium]